jgi:predicted nucleotidyltransferase
MEIEEVKKEISKIIKEELSNLSFSAFFFGSRVTGTALERSDIDVGIEGETSLPDENLRRIKSRCESLPTLYMIDIVDFTLIGEDFKKVAKSKIEKII